MGSTGTYIGYLSGNVGAMRFPVALNLQSSMKADIGTARGQIVTIIGIVASVFMNLVLLLFFMLGGEWLLDVLPAAVIAALSFVMVSLWGSMLSTFWNGAEGIVKGAIKTVPYLVTALIVRYIVKQISALSMWRMAIVVCSCVIVAYFIYKNDCKKEQAAQADAAEK